ncbi:10376_t:CDS:2 [Dentiscutata erythropus]|uniref:10376_t:CDS:1 n=1 Tax=Dentiscutata erythropus TaxID=1348616 RepID=A0A9N9BHN8_9GLOM|nr:10376_t:CDS:2 [Dentiscutata erythropus]
MATKTATPKIQKPKVNNFVLVLEQFLEKHNLTADSTPEQLNKHASKLDALLPDWMAHRCVKVALARGTDNRCSFSEERIEALLPDKRKGKLTIEERAKYCAKIGDAMDIFAHHLDLGPKNDYENEIVASGSRQSQFRVKLAEGGVSPEIINTYVKDPKLIQEVFKRIQNMDVSKILSKEDLTDIIVMLSMRPAEVRSLQIIHYEPDPLNAPVWYKEGYLKSREEKKKNSEPRPFLSMEKSPERARELLTWIQNTIKAKKLRDPVFTENETHYGSKHASRIHGGDNYAIGDTELEKSDSKPETSDSSKPQIQASSSSQTI